MDFVSSHLYPTDPQINATEGVNGFYNKLKEAGEILNKYNNKYKLYLSEFNSGLYKANVDNHDNNIAAAFVIFHANKLQPLITNYNYGWLSYWAFSDIFEERDFNSNEFCNDFGIQTIRGISKPVLRAFELLNMASNVSYNTTRRDANNDNGTIQIFVVENKNDNKQYLMYIANWNLYGQSIMNQTVSIEIKNSIDNGTPKQGTMYRIDELNVNPAMKWRSFNSPEYPTNAGIDVSIIYMLLLS